MDNYELIATLEEAQEKMMEALELMGEVYAETGNETAKTYLIDHLTTLTSNNHGFMSRDYNVDNWIESLREEA